MLRKHTIIFLKKLCERKREKECGRKTGNNKFNKEEKSINFPSPTTTLNSTPPEKARKIGTQKRAVRVFSQNLVHKIIIKKFVSPLLSVHSTLVETSMIDFTPNEMLRV